jgi:hypothetical protein
MDLQSFKFEQRKEQIKLIAISLLIFFSLSSIHYVTYVMYLPIGIRALLDGSFKIDFAAKFAVTVIFSFFCARYIPQTFLAVSAHVIQFVIEFKYHKRGYRRVATFSGLADCNSIEEIKRYRDRLQRFGRKEARLDNLVRRVIQRSLPVLFYEEHKLLFTAPLAVYIGLLFYLGTLPALILSLLTSFLVNAFHTYLSFNDRFRFSLRGIYSGDKPDYQPKPYSIGTTDLFIFAATCAVVVGIAGPLRLRHEIREINTQIILATKSIDAALIGTTSQGILFYDTDYGFLPYVSVVEIRKVDLD